MSDSGTTRRGFMQVVLAAGVAGVAEGVELAPPDKQPVKLAIPGPVGRKVGYAVVGLGELALGEVMPAFALCEHSRPVALVSGHPEKAKKVAEHYGIEAKSIYGYENFDAIKDDPAIEVVYVILPNSMHAEFTVRALAAGKHVLCEKPMAPTAGECQKMIDAGKAAGRKLMIAYRLQHEPFNRAMIEIARKKEFGKVQFIEAQNLQQVKAPNIRLSKETAGGAIWDVGVYCVNAARYITGEEPAEVVAMTYSDPGDPRFAEVDETTSAILRFPSGAMASCTGGFSAAESRRYRVNCEKGWFELEKAFGYEGQRMRVKPSGESESGSGAGGGGGKVEEREIKAVNHFASEMDFFSDCVMNDKPVRTPGEEGLADVRVIEAILRSAREGRAVKLT